MPGKKVNPKSVNLRWQDFLTASCELCRYYSSSNTCQVVEGEILFSQVCDLYQGRENLKDTLYVVKEEDMESFIDGMVKTQPYQHKVLGGFFTPVGWLISIEDTMKPKSHRFSISAEFHVVHTSREHSWTQEEVDKIIDSG